MMLPDDHEAMKSRQASWAREITDKPAIKGTSFRTSNPLIVSLDEDTELSKLRNMYDQLAEKYHQLQLSISKISTTQSSQIDELTSRLFSLESGMSLADRGTNLSKFYSPDSDFSVVDKDISISHFHPCWIAPGISGRTDYCRLNNNHLEFQVDVLSHNKQPVIYPFGFKTITQNFNNISFTMKLIDVHENEGTVKGELSLSDNNIYIIKCSEFVINDLIEIHELALPATISANIQLQSE